MPDFNDVVRHVILRILVDSAGMAEELAKARAQLKAQEQAERDSNKARAKDAEQVTKAYDKQAQALRDNADAQDRLAKQSDRTSQQQSERIKQSTKDVQDATKAQTEQLKAISGERDKEQARQLARYKAEQAARLAYDKGISESAERMSREQQKVNEQLSARRLATTDEETVRQATRPTRIETAQHVSRETGRQATAVADSAEYAADIAKTDALNAAEQRVTESVRRRRSLITDEKRSKQELINLAKVGEVLEQRALSIAEQRARTEERSSTARRRGLGASLGNVARMAGDVGTGVARAVFSAPRSAARAGREFDSKQFDEAGSAASRAEKTIAAFFTSIGQRSETAANAVTKVARSFKEMSGLRANTGQSGLGNVQVEAKALGRAFEFLESGGSKVAGMFRRVGGDADSNVRRVQRFRAQITGFFEDVNRARGGGSGGSLFSDFIGKGAASLQALDGVFSGVGRHLISFQNLIFLVVAAFGPLAAILGGVGAAALALGSNLVSLAGSIAALPGLLSAAVAGFGALYIAIKPLSNVFSAYTAAQKAAAKGSAEASKAAVDAANAVEDAQRRLDDAQLAHTRAVEDLPRAEQKLSDARKQAVRDIEDLRDQYQKLKYDEEGASLDVESSEQAYKRALVDPTSTSLDRRQARHDVEGSLWDQRDQQKNAQRVQQDYAEAMQKGVEGMDAVVDALRSLVDARRAVTDTDKDAARAAQDLAEAQKDQAAGGSAARTAMDAYQAELAKLSPEARTVVQAILDMGDAWKAMQKRFETKVFGPLAKDTGLFKDVLKELEDFLSPAADAFGGLADQAIKLLTNPDWKKFFSSQGEANGRIIATLGQAALDAADGFRAIVEVAQPFTDFVVGGLANMAKTFGDFANSKEGRKEIAGFLDTTKQRMGEIGKVIGNLVGGFAGFFKALSTPAGGKEDFTTWFNRGLINASASFKALGEEAANPNSGFRKWLEQVKPLLSDIGKFLGKVADFAGNLFSNQSNLDEARALLGNIGDAVKGLADVFDHLSESGIISKVAAAIKSVVETIDKIGDSGGFKALSVFGDAIKLAAGAVDVLISGLSKVPGLLTAIGAVIGVVFGAALLKKISQPIVSLVRFFRGLTADVKNPANSSASDDTPTGTATTGTTKNDKTRPMQVGRTGGTGVAGNTSNTSANTSLWSRIRNRLPGGGTNKPDDDTPSRWSRLQSRLTPDPDSRLGRLSNRINPRDNDTGTTRFGRTATSVKNTGSTIFSNAKTQALGDTRVEPTLGRMETQLDKIESLLKKIERNTRRGTGGTSSKGGGSGGGGGGGGRPTGTSGGGGGSSTRPTSTRPTSIPGAAVREVVDPYSTTTSGTGTKPANPRQTKTTTSTPAGTYSAARQAENERRDKAGLKPLPPDVQSTPKPKTSAKPGSVTSTSLPSSISSTSNYHPNPATVDYQDQPGTSVRRNQTTTIDGEVVTPTSVVPSTSTSSRRTQSTSTDLKLHPGQPWNYVTPALPGGNADTRIEGHPNPRQITGTAVEDDDDNALPSNKLKPALPSAEDDTPALPGGKSQRELTTTASPMALPAGGSQKPTRDRFGRFRKDPAAAATQPRGEGGRFRKTTEGETKPSPTRDPKTGRFTKDPVKTAPVRDPKTGRFTKSTTVDIDDDGTPTKKPSIAQRIRNKNKEILGNDSGSVGLGIGTRDTKSTRRSRSTGSRLRFGRNRGKGAGLGGLVEALAGGAIGGAVAGGDDEYEEGYEDGLAAAGGGGNLPGTRGREGRRVQRANSRAVGDIVDGELADDLPSTERAARKGLPSAERSIARRGLPAAERVATRGGALRRLGGGLGRGLTRAGGSLARGALGGAGGIAASLALSFGGQAAIDHFVKNDADASSLSRGLGAVSTGAGIGSAIGSFIPGVGTLVGGAVGGLAGGAYSLIKDKNLRNFVGGKIGGAVSGVGSAIGGAAKGVGNFFGNVGDKIGGLFGGGGGGGKDDKGGLGLLKGGLAALFPVGGIASLILGKTDIGKSILDSLKKAGRGVGDFFTKDIPHFFSEGVKGIENFFMKTLPGLPKKAAAGLIFGLGFLFGFFTERLPRLAAHFFTKTLPDLGKKAASFVLAGFAVIGNFFTETLPALAQTAWDGITNFFTVTLPRAAQAAWDGITTFFTVTLPGAAQAAWDGITNFFTVTLPKAAQAVWDGITSFFTETLPTAAQAAWDGITNFFTKTLPDAASSIFTTIKDFFTKDVPGFFTETLPHAISQIPGMLYDNLVRPVVDFFKGLKSHIHITDLFTGASDLWNWAKGLFSAGAEAGAGEKKMSGGLIQGIYQGIQDKAHVMATPGEFMFRKSVVDEPGAKAIMTDWNEGRIKVSDLLGGLSASTAPQVRSIVPPSVQALTGAVPTVVNNTVNHAPLAGDITIYNPKPEPSERSLRRQLQVAANRHRR